MVPLVDGSAVGMSLTLPMLKVFVEDSEEPYYFEEIIGSSKWYRRGIGHGIMEDQTRFILGGVVAAGYPLTVGQNLYLYNRDGSPFSAGKIVRIEEGVWTPSIGGYR